MATTAINTLAYGITIAIIALSLVLLTGYAGEINLAALSFGAIGTIIVFHFGITGTGNDARMTLWGILLAAIACAVVGALVALPALRLRGLYLALATMAFGVFVSRMVLTEIGQREIFGWKFSIFEGGSLTIPRPEIGPLDFKSNESFLMLVTVVFAPDGHRPRVPAPQLLRPSPRRHEGQPGGVRHPRHERRAPQAVGVHALGRHRRRRRRAHVGPARLGQPRPLRHLHQPRVCC